MSRIFIEARNVLSADADAVNDSSFQHLYLVYQDDSGAEYVIRGGPTNKIFTPAWIVEGFGPIVVDAGGLLKDSRDKRVSEGGAIVSPETRGQIELDLGGRSAEDVWFIMLQQALQIADQGIFYHLDFQNSNSLVATVLNAVGITDIPQPNGQHFPGDHSILGLIFGGGYFFDVGYELEGTTSRDLLRGAQGSDELRGRKGDDLIDGWIGDDILIGGVGADRLYGGFGDDILIGGRRDDDEFEYHRLPNGVPIIGTLPEFPDISDDFSNWDDDEADYLYGGYGDDLYIVGAAGVLEVEGWDDDRTISIEYGFVDDPSHFNNNFYDYIDVIRDTDGQGTIWYSLDGLEEIGLNREFRELTETTYQKSDFQFFGKDAWGDFIVDRYTDPENGITADRLVFVEFEVFHAIFVIDGFTNGDFGITLEGYTPGSIDALDDESTDSIDGTRGEDTINSYGGDDTIQGYAGADTIDGGTGFDTVLYSQSQGGVTVNLELGITLGGDAEGDVLISIENLTGSDFVDELIGNALSNTLLGGAGDDRLDGGLGEDFLDGGLGTDIFLWTIGMGNDLIVDSGDVGEGDTLRFGAGVLSSAVRLASNGTDLILTIGAEFISLIGYHVSTSVDFIAFDDGTVWDFAKVAELLSPSDLNVIEVGDDGGYFVGTDGDDNFIGGAGDDVFAAGDGADMIDGGGGDYNQVDYIGAAADYLFTPNDDNTISVDDGSGEIDTLSNIDGIWFIGEDKWYSVDSLLVHSGINVIEAGDGGGYFTGSDGDDHFVGGAGDDTFSAGTGADIIDGGSGGYDQVDYAGAASDYTFIANDDGTISVDDGSGEIDTLSNIDGIWFVGESAWYNISALVTSVTGPYVIDGTAEDDLLFGSAGDDIMNGFEGLDTFIGSAGDDIINGGDDGYNQVNYDGARSDYLFSENDDGTVTATSDADGIDTLSDIGGIWFAADDAWYDMDNLIA